MAPLLPGGGPARQVEGRWGNRQQGDELTGVRPHGAATRLTWGIEALRELPEQEGRAPYARGWGIHEARPAVPAGPRGLFRGGRDLVPRRLLPHSSAAVVHQERKVAMSTTEQGGQAPEGPAPTLPPISRAFFLCFGVLGFSTGVFVGLSESPVVGTLLTGVLSLFAGGLLAVFALKKDSVSLTAENLNGLAISIICFCLLCLAGSVVGIWMRKAVLPALFTKAEAKPPLADLKVVGKGVPHDKLVRLLMIQATLKNLGVGEAENNLVIEGLLDSMKSNTTSLAFGSGGQVDRLHQYIRLSRSLAEAQLLEGGGRDLWETRDEIEAVVKEYKITDAKRVARLNKVDAFMKRKRALDSGLLQLVRRDANEAEVALFELRQPELDVIIEHVTTYGSRLSGLQPGAPKVVEKKELGLAH